jgi:hypothetical protein
MVSDHIQELGVHGDPLHRLGRRKAGELRGCGSWGGVGGQAKVGCQTSQQEKRRGTHEDTLAAWPPLARVRWGPA